MLSACNHTDFYRESYAVINVSNRRKHLIFLFLRLNSGMCLLCSHNCTKVLFTPRKRTLSLIIVGNKVCKWTESVRWKILAVSHKTTPFFCRCIFYDTLWFAFYLFGGKWQTEEPALPCPCPGLALPNTFIVDPSDIVMSWAKGKVKIPSRSLSHGFTRQCLPFRVTAIIRMKNV